MNLALMKGVQLKYQTPPPGVTGQGDGQCWGGDMPFAHSPELGVGVPTVPPSLMAVVPPQPGTEVALMGGVTSLSPFPLRGTVGWGGGHQQRGGHRPWWVAFPPLRQQLKIPPCAGAGLGHSSGRSAGTQPGTHPNASPAPTRKHPRHLRPRHQEPPAQVGTRRDYGGDTYKDVTPPGTLTAGSCFWGGGPCMMVLPVWLGG